MSDSIYTNNKVFTKADLLQISQCRRLPNQLGFAYMLAYVRMYSRFPKQVPLEIVHEPLQMACLALNCDPSLVNEYAQRQQTVSTHRVKIQKYLSLKVLKPQAEKHFIECLQQEAMRTDRLSALVTYGKQWLLKNHFIYPSEITISRLVASARKMARVTMSEKLTTSLAPSMIQTLETLLIVKDGDPWSVLHKIKTNPSKASSTAMRQLMEKMDAIESTGVLNIDTNWLNSNYQRSLFHLVRTSNVDRLKAMGKPRLYLALVCFLHQSWRDAIDQAIDMYGKLLERHQKQVKNSLDNQLKSQRRSIDRIIKNYTTITSILLDSNIEAASLKARLLEVIAIEDLQTDFSELTQWTRGDSGAKFAELCSKHTSLTRFATPLLTRLEFVNEQQALNPALMALELYRTLKKKKKAELPVETPIEFLPASIRQKVINKDGSLDRKSWESALFLRIRDELKAGNLAVEGAKNFGRFEHFFMPMDNWKKVQVDFWVTNGFPANPQEAGNYLKARLDKAFDSFLHNSESVKVQEVDGRLKLVPGQELISQQPEDEQRELRKWLTSSRRTIRLADLLIEVDNDLGFSDHFTSGVCERSSPENVCALLAAILAHGCNLGLHTMEKLTPGINYKQLKRISQMLLTPENQRAALGAIVRGISSLDISHNWGKGNTSASDGQRFAMPQKVLQQTYSTRFNDFALEFYSFVADNYAPFYSRPIECTDRDAPFVLDGVLYHESELDLEEHFTDTHGYTEINFAAFAMLGKRFCPRIKNLHHQRIYCASRDRDHGWLEPVLGRGRKSINFKVIAQNWDRLGRFFASFPSGLTTASTALQRLNRFKPTNEFYKAARELGRMLKSEFVLEYMLDPHLRSRIRKGLLKVEQLHALARVVYYGNRGRVSAREIHDQVKSCSCLTLILACIVYWQSKEIASLMEEASFPVDTELIKTISPIEWNNIVLYGEYKLDPRKIRIKIP